MRLKGNSSPIADTIRYRGRSVADRTSEKFIRVRKPSQAAWNFYVKRYLFYCISLGWCQTFIDCEILSPLLYQTALMSLLHQRWNGVSFTVISRTNVTATSTMKQCLFYCIKPRECQSYVDGESVSVTVLNWVMPLLHRRWNSLFYCFKLGWCQIYSTVFYCIMLVGYQSCVDAETMSIILHQLFGCRLYQCLFYCFKLGWCLNFIDGPTVSLQLRENPAQWVCSSIF